MNPFEIGDRVTRNDRTYYDGTVVEIVNEGLVRVYWRRSSSATSTTGVYGPNQLVRKV